MNAFNRPIAFQVSALARILAQSLPVSEALRRAEALDLPNWYLGAGCIAQTVWNHLSSKELGCDINDLDLVYFDSADLSNNGEKKHASKVNEAFKEIPIRVDVKNQARVHLWYEERFGHPIKPYPTVEDAINSWPTTATCVGVRTCEGSFIVYAPYGLNDLFGMIAKANKVQITEEIYLKKVERWKACWPKLTIVPWST